MFTLALIGYPLSHSFSQKYFTEKFDRLGISERYRYVNIELTEINDLKKNLDEYPDLLGFNVTIPHKQTILPLLDEVDPAAARIGAVNTVKIEDGRLVGYNTDFEGFRNDLLAGLTREPRFSDFPGTRDRALVLGTGGASLAVAEALRTMNVQPTFVSRRPGKRLIYKDVTPEVLDHHRLIVNTTPLGMHPKVDTAPELPYEALNERHFCYDLVYNPTVTRFMQLAMGAGAGARNGLGMLHLQAEAAWKIWNGKKVGGRG